MEQKSSISKSTAIIMGIMLLMMGGIALIIKMNLVGSVLLLIIGIIGIVGGFIGKFEEKDET